MSKLTGVELTVKRELNSASAEVNVGSKGGNDAVAVAGPLASDVKERREALNRILRSAVFKNSLLLQKFLEYITLKSLEGLDDEIKEYPIGTEVFGRPADFDPKIDPVVRVEAYRLRDKLKEYYRREGAQDLLVLEIPKGHYVPRFVHLKAAGLGGGEISDFAPSSSSGDANSSKEQIPPGLLRASRAHGRRWVWPGSIIAAIFIFLGGLYAGRLWRPASPLPAALSSARSGSAPEGEGALKNLWKGFLGGQSEASAFFQDHVFLETDNGEMVEYFGSPLAGQGASTQNQPDFRKIIQHDFPGYAGSVFYDDGYTGTGEAQSIGSLTQLFLSLGASLNVSPSRRLTAGDLSRSNVIFLGAGADRLIGNQVPVNRNFVFQGFSGSGGIWTDRIHNRRPARGEAEYYYAELDPTTKAMVGDWALISFLPGIVPNRRMAVLAGLSTAGTLAAAQFSTSPRGAATLLRELSPASAGSSRTMPPFFQALLKVEIVKGAVVGVHYVCGRVLQPGPQ